jgi:hypothetical protein
MHKFILLLALAATSAPAADSWKVIISDSLGNPLWELSAPRTVPQASGCEFFVTAKNISQLALPGPFLRISVSVPERRSISDPWAPLPTNLTGVNAARSVPSGESTEARAFFPMEPELQGKPQDLKITAMDITRTGDWQSWQEVEAAKKHEAEAADRVSLLRSFCHGVHASTIDKAQRDLTIRDTQAVAYCISVGWYQ